MQCVTSRGPLERPTKRCRPARRPRRPEKSTPELLLKGGDTRFQKVQQQATDALLQLSQGGIRSSKRVHQPSCPAAGQGRGKAASRRWLLFLLQEAGQQTTRLSVSSCRLPGPGFCLQTNESFPAVTGTLTVIQTDAQQGIRKPGQQPVFLLRRP